MNKFEQALPNGTEVKAFDDGVGHMVHGYVTTHTIDTTTGEDGLIIRFDSGRWLEYPYGYIDTEDWPNSFVQPVK